MDILRNFYNNTPERKSVEDFLIANLKDLAVEKAFKGESVAGIPEAKRAIEKAFETLGDIYGKIEKPPIINSR